MDLKSMKRKDTQSPRAIAGWIILGNLLVAAVLIAATLSNLAAGRADDIERAHRAADNLAHGLSIELASELRLVDNALTTVALRYLQVDGQPDRERQMDRSLQEQRLLLPFARALRIADAQGEVTHGLPPELSHYSVLQRPYFAQARQAGGTQVSEPLYSDVFNDWCIVVARRLDGVDGSFRGVVYAVLSQDHFHRLFAKLSVGEQGAISLRSGSMRLAARYSAVDPASAAGLGGQEISARLRQRLQADPQQGWYMTETALDGVERIVAYRRLPGYDYVVLAGFGTQSYLAGPWAEDALRYWGFTGLVLVLIAIGSVFLYWQHRRQYRIASYAARLAREQNLMLDNDLVGMMRVRDRQICWANPAVVRILGYSEEALRGAPTRLAYKDDDSYQRVGALAYAALQAEGRFRTQVQLRTADQREVWMDLSGAALSESESIWMMVDIDKLKRSEELAQHLALHDPLTGLANRRLFEEHLQLGLAHAQRTGHGMALCYMDLDGFKPVNDRHGHEAGDEVLREIGLRLRRELRSNDSVARLGGDEFAWLLTGVDDADKVLPLLQRCEAAIRRPILLSSGASVSVGCSMGVAFAGRDGHSSEDLLAAADEAMYQAKRAGRGRVQLAGAGKPMVAEAG